MILNNMCDKSDDELIKMFVNDSNEQAFDILLRRYYSIIYQRIIKSVQNEDEARDICQKLWLRVLTALENYQFNNKFEHFLNKIATNLIKDEWRSQQSNRVAAYENTEQAIDDAFSQIAFDSANNLDEAIDKQRLINKLVYELIPALPEDQRLIYLLKHEAELWDQETPLQWQNLADLVAMSVENVCEMFDSARDKLFKNTTYQEIQYSLTEEEKTVFLVWTMSQRQDKRKKYTESYFAELLNIPVNTLKTRYRSALKTLSAGMSS